MLLEQLCIKRGVLYEDIWLWGEQMRLYEGQLGLGFYLQI